MLPLHGVDFPEAVFAEGADHQPFAVRAEGGPGRALVRFEEVERVNQLAALSVPDVGALALPIAGGQPSAVGTKGGVSQPWTLNQQLATRVLGIIEQGLAELRAIGHGATVGTQREIRVIADEGGTGRKSQRLRRAYPQ